MSKKPTEDEINELARFAGLELTDAERSALIEHLGKQLETFAALSDVDLTNAERFDGDCRIVGRCLP